MNHLTDIKIELWKRGNYDLLTSKDFIKQIEAWTTLTDNSISELLYGGAAGGAKSYTGWMWCTMQCLSYKEVHYFVARETLKDIRLYGMQTFSEVCRDLQLEKDIDYKYNAQDSIIIFPNGSKIYLLECKKKPSDVDFHGLGSSLFTGGFIEEAGEVHFDAYDTLKTRINRWNNDKYNILGTLFITGNPSKNWTYKDFYKANKENTLKDYQKFIPALATDNPFSQKNYINNLRNTKDKTRKQRLLYGNWEYDDDPYWLINDYDTLLDVFKNRHVTGVTRYITCDAARFGSDKAIILAWEGWKVIEAYKYDMSATTEISSKIIELQKKYKIANRHTVVDADGVGGGVVDQVNCVGFVNNSKAIFDKTDKNYGKGYNSLKDQCAFKLAEKINNSELYICANLIRSEEEEIKEELEQLKRQLSDGKQKIIKKDVIKEFIGRSPDWLDSLLMRSYFDLKIRKSIHY